jgi:GTP-binding protein LepA
MELIKSKRGSDWGTTIMDDEQWMFVAQLPWGEVVTDFSDALKNVTSGYGSVDLGAGDPPLRAADLCKVDVLLNSEAVEPLAFVCHRDAAPAQARAVCQRLQAVLPRQQFATVIQAKAGNKIIASERIKAYRKDVLTKSGKVVGGGDMTRKKKLLEKQKEGKKRMQQSGKVTLSQEAFNSVISRGS